MTCFTKEKTKVQWGEAIYPKMGVRGWASRARPSPVTLDARSPARGAHARSAGCRLQKQREEGKNDLEGGRFSQRSFICF